MTTLYSIGSDLLQINDYLDSIGGDLSQAPPGFIDWLDSTETSEAEKAESYRGLIKQLEMEAERARQEAREWADRARSRESRIAWLREHMRLHMIRTGQDQIRTTTGRSFSLRDGKPPLIFTPDADPTTAALDYVRVKYEWDKTEIRKVLDEGGELPFAHLGEPEKELVLR